MVGGNIDNYIESKMIFDKKSKNDYISPILLKNELIGYCYIYKQNLNYKNCMNYYNLLSSEKIINSIKIYYNYKSIEEKLKNKKANKEKYYIISKSMSTEIKNNNDFKIIYEIMQKNNIEENDENSKKKILSALKNLSDNEINMYKQKVDKKSYEYQDFFSPNIISVNYFDKSEKQIIIYDNF